MAPGSGCFLHLDRKLSPKNRNLQVVVDLSMSGARINNYISSPVFNGLSAVESAVAQMLDEGIQIVRQIKWN